MKLNEIKDPNLAASLARMAKDYGPGGALAPRARPTEQELEDRKKKHNEYLAQKDRVEQALAPIALRLSGDQFEEFKQEAEKLVPPDQLKLVQLDLVFNHYNPDKKRENEESWAHYGRQRAADTSGFDD